MQTRFLVFGATLLTVTGLLMADEPAKHLTAATLIKQLNASNERDREKAVEQLASMGDSVIPVLVERLDDPNKRIASGCRDALHQIGIRALPALTKALSAKTPQVRQYAASAFVGMEGDKSPAVPALIAALSDQDRNVRWTVIYALKVIKDRRSFFPLAMLLLDKDEETRSELPHEWWTPS